jgi:hypothetical protein
MITYHLAGEEMTLPEKVPLSGAKRRIGFPGLVLRACRTRAEQRLIPA